MTNEEKVDKYTKNIVDNSQEGTMFSSYKKAKRYVELMLSGDKEEQRVWLNKIKGDVDMEENKVEVKEEEEEIVYDKTFKLIVNSTTKEDGDQIHTTINSEGFGTLAIVGILERALRDVHLDMDKTVAEQKASEESIEEVDELIEEVIKISGE